MAWKMYNVPKHIEDQIKRRIVGLSYQCSKCYNWVEEKALRCGVCGERFENYYGKILDSCSCGTAIYIKTDKGAYKVECDDPDVQTTGGVLTSIKVLECVEYPLPSQE